MQYEGIAIMYMSMPMTSDALPVLGSCLVNDDKLALKFPTSAVAFDLPEAPRENPGSPMEFKMAGPRGEILLKVEYKQEMRAFMGKGTQFGQNVLTFVFYRADCPLKNLKLL